MDTRSFAEGQIVTISASSNLQLDDDNKVTGTDDGTDINFVWEEGDKVLVKVGEASAEFTLKTGAGTATATFEGTMPAAGNTFDMQYPVETPDLSSQDYVAYNQIPKGKMLFMADGCTLGSNAELKPQYAVLQVNLNGPNFTTGDHYFRTIQVYFNVKESETYTQKYYYQLNVPDNTVMVPYTLTADYAPFYIVVNPGTYGIEVCTQLNDSYPAKKVSTTSDKTFEAGKCLNMPGAGITSCFAAGTRITMADGSIKKVEDIVEGDIIRTFDHEAGCISSQKVCLTYNGDVKINPLNLTFASGKTLSIVGTHDLLFKDSLKYVHIDSDNVESFVGKQFYNAENGEWDELVSFGIGTETVAFYCIYSASHLNCIAEGMLTCPDDVDYLLNIYELDANLKADPIQLASDIREYGLWNYSEIYPEYAEYAKQWEDLQFKYMRIATGKGLITKSELLEMLSFWGGE